MIRILTIAAVTLGAAPALADDFMIIHMNNQKVGSPVSAYWHAEANPVQTDGFMAIHRDNQKTGSLIVAFWNAYATVSERNFQMGLHVDNQTFLSAVVDVWSANWSPVAVSGAVARVRE